MAKNEVFKVGSFVSLPVDTGAVSGSPVRIGELNVVLQTSEGSVDRPLTNNTYVSSTSGNEPGYASVALEGAFRLPVSTATTLSVGDPVYIITATNVLTTTDNSGANPLFGHALSPKGSTANQPVIVRIAN